MLKASLALGGGVLANQGGIRFLLGKQQRHLSSFQRRLVWSDGVLERTPLELKQAHANEAYDPILTGPHDAVPLTCLMSAFTTRPLQYRILFFSLCWHYSVRAPDPAIDLAVPHRPDSHPG